MTEETKPETPAEKLVNAFNAKPAKLLDEDAQTHTSGGVSARRWQVDDLEIFVGEDGSVAYKKRYYGWAGRPNLLPNLTYSDGAMTIPIEDIAHLILARLDPDEIASALWIDDKVRERFLFAVTERYSSDSVTDLDRRKLLRDLKASVHSRAQDALIEKISELELELRSRTSYHRWKAMEVNHYERVLKTVRKLAGDEIADAVLKENNTPEALAEYWRDEQKITDPAQRESVGKEWWASRDYWRDYLAKQFPLPEKVTPAEEIVF